MCGLGIDPSSYPAVYHPSGLGTPLPFVCHKSLVMYYVMTSGELLPANIVVSFASRGKDRVILK